MVSEASPDILLAFVAGVLSVLSPCVLPLMPAYLSLVSGLSLDELREGERDTELRRRVMRACLGFVAGFTLVFVIAERTTGKPGPEFAWSPDRLPDVPTYGRLTPLELALSVAGLVFAAVFIVWQQVASPVTIAGVTYPMFDPALWSFWLPYFLVLIALEMLFAIAVYAWGWTWWLAIANLVLNVAFTVPALWLFATGQLINPEFLEVIGWPWGEASAVTTTVLVVVFVGVAIWDVVDGVIKTVRGRGGSALAVGRI